ncbi:MAG: DUF1559 domain-containing protein [Planctomycetales bacterium]|nr:DUF1559 domain-containing protein [Planctomycetales bacterium]
MNIHHLLLSAISIVLFASTLCGQQNNTASTESDFRAANPTTIVLVKVDTKQLAVPSWLESGQPAVIGKRLVELIKTAAGPSDFFATVDVPYSASQPVVRLLVPTTNSSDTQTTKTLIAKLSATEPVVIDGFVVASPIDDVTADLPHIDHNVLSIDHTRYAAAESAVSEFPVKILIVPPAHIWETYEELLPELPVSLGGGPTSVITKGVKWAAIGVNPQDGTVSGTIQSENAAAAKVFAERLPAFVPQLLRQIPDGANLSTWQITIESLLKLAEISVDGDAIQLEVANDATQAVRQAVTSIVGETGGPIALNRKRNQMQQLVLGMLNHESAWASFPPIKKMRGDDGKSGLSWRVHILPFLDEIELYQKFKLDEPWDSPHNINLLGEMPDVFRTYSNSGLTDPVLKPGYTTFVAPVGEGTIMGGNEVVKVRHIVDGTSKTVLLVEVTPGRAVPWTAPKDYNFPMNEPGAGLAWDKNGQVGVAFCDGHWRAIPKSTSKETLRNLFMMNDGNAVDLK